MNKRWITIPLRIIVTAVITLLVVYFYYKSLERKVIRLDTILFLNFENYKSVFAAILFAPADGLCSCAY